jgi:hypothetical protein
VLLLLQMKDYLDDLLVWAIIIAILTPIVIALFKRKRAFIFIVGFLLILGAGPAAFMSELSMNGCCGAPSTGREGLGYIFGVLMVFAGILIMVFSKKLAKQ